MAESRHLSDTMANVEGSPRSASFKEESSSVYGLATDQQSNSTRPSPASEQHDSHDRSDEVPDGGMRAWMQVLGVHMGIASVWGFVNAWGVFQTYYSAVMLPNTSSSTISWIGSVQNTLAFCIGVVSGRLADAGYFYWMCYLGISLQVLGVLMTSFAKTYVQILLSQGLCFGLGGGLAFTPMTALLSTYFQKKNGMVMALTAAGSTTGGLIFPVIARQLLPKIGFAWTMRVIALVMLVFNSIAVLTLRWRLPARKNAPWLDFSALTDRVFALSALAMYFANGALYFAFCYVGVYATSRAGFDYTESINLLLVMISIGLPGRIIPGIVADRWTGPVNLLIVVIFTTAVVIFLWFALVSQAGLYVFSALYGLSGGGIQSLYPAMLSALSPDPETRGTRMGIGFLITSLAVLSSPPIAGVLITEGHGNFMYAQLWAGISMLIGCVLLLCARIVKTGLVLKVKM